MELMHWYLTDQGTQMEFVELGPRHALFAADNLPHLECSAFYRTVRDLMLSGF